MNENTNGSRGRFIRNEYGFDLCIVISNIQQPAWLNIICHALLDWKQRQQQ